MVRGDVDYCSDLFCSVILLTTRFHGHVTGRWLHTRKPTKRVMLTQALCGFYTTAQFLVIHGLAYAIAYLNTELEACFSARFQMSVRIHSYI